MTNFCQHIFEPLGPYTRGFTVLVKLGEPGADLGGGCRGCVPPPPEMTCGFLIQLVFCEKKTMWFIGVEVEQETGAPPPKKSPGSAPENFDAKSLDIVPVCFKT